MNLLRVSLRNLKIRALSTTLTTTSIVVATALVASLWLISAQVQKRYHATARGYEAIVGPKEGAPLSLVLNTVFGLGSSPGVVPMSVYRELHEGRVLYRNRPVPISYAIPQARGDHYRTHPIVGTTEEMFSRFQPGDTVGLTFAEGRAFAFGHQDFLDFAKQKADEQAALRTAGGDGPKQPTTPGPAHGEPGHVHGPECAAGVEIPLRWREAVIGSQVARRLGISLGYEIVPVHGKPGDPDAHLHQEASCRVVGILEPTNSPIDLTVYIPLGAFLSMDQHHAIRDTQEAEADNVLLSSIIVKTKSHLGGPWLRYAFQTRADAQVAWPRNEIDALIKMVGDVTEILRVISWLVMVVAGAAILVALYNTMNERRREIAILRSLGARRSQIAQIVLQEAMLVSFVGAVLGVAVCHLAALVFATTIEARTGVSIDWAAFTVEEAWLILGVTVIGGIAGLLPAIKGSLTQVADNLAPTT